MLELISTFAWPIIGTLLLVILCLWLCHVIKNNAITTFFSRPSTITEQEPRRQDELHHPQEQHFHINHLQLTEGIILQPPEHDTVRTTTNLPRRQQPQEHDIVRTTINLPRRQQRNNRHNFITTTLRNLTLLTLIVGTDGPTISIFPITCSCEKVNEGATFIIDSETDIVIELLPVKHLEPLDCRCWNKYGWDCPHLQLSTNPNHKKIDRFSSRTTYTTKITAHEQTETPKTLERVNNLIKNAIVAIIITVMTLFTLGTIARTIRSRLF